MKYEYIPREHYCIIEKEKMSKALITVDNLQSSEQAGTLFRIVTVGEGVDFVKPGDLVSIVGYIHTVDHDGKKLTLVKDTEILLVVKEKK